MPSSLQCHRCGEPYQQLTSFGKPIKNGAKCADCRTTFCLGFTGKEYLCTECAIARVDASEILRQSLLQRLETLEQRR